MNRLIGTTLIMLGLAAGLSAQSITIGTASTSPGGSAAVSVQFSPGSAQVAGVQFDILYDSTQLTAITAAAGAATTAAGKGLSTSHPACPGGSGVANCADLRIIDAGLNQNTISAGDIVDLGITVAGAATPQVNVLTAAGTSASDPNGLSLALAGSNGSVSVLAVLAVTGPATLPTGTISVAYPSTTIAAGGGTPPYTFSATGFTGTGLSFSSAGAITGTPTASGSFPIVVTLKDSASGTATKNYTLTINPALSITGPASLPNGTAGSAYTATTVTASGGSGTGYTFTASALPAGLSIGASTGTISGTPAASFNGSVTVTVTDSNSATANKVYTLAVSGPLGISGPTSLPVATVSAPYSVTIVGSGGSGGYSWVATGLPAGLSIASATGIISGTPTTNTGSPFSVNVTVTDTSSQATVSKAYTLTVNPALVITAPTTLPAGTAGKAYTSTAATATGGSGTYTWTGTGLPSGLTVASATGIISGTPAAAFTGNVSLVATDANLVTASKSLPLTIYAALTISTPTSLPAATVNSAYPSTTVAATGGSGTNTWSATGLPPGLSIGSGTGVISGTPNTTTGSPFAVVVTVNDTASNTATQNYSIAINPAISITAPATLPVGTVTAAYTATTVTATGGTGTLTFSATGLPAGLSIATATGIISGTPTTSTGSPFTVIVTATDTVGATGTKSFALVINPVLTITGPATLPNGIPQVAYTATTITATGGAGAPYTFTATGLPAGMTISAAGVISGTPTSSVGSPFTVVVTVTDSNTVKATKTYSLALAPPLLIQGPATLPGGTANLAIVPVTFTATGGSGTYTFTATGLPPGLTLSTAGVLAGIPTGSGTFTIVVTVKDTNNTTASTSPYTVVIAAQPLKITSGQLPNGVIGVPYQYFSITASGGVGAYGYTVTGLPPGLTTDGNGDISGTPTSTAGSPFTVTVTITDGGGNSATSTYKVTISPVLSVGAPASLPNGAVGTAYTATTVTAAGGAAPYTWAATGLPAGLSIGIATGTISGTPTTATGSPFSVVVTVTDSTGAKATKTYSLSLNAGGLTITGPASLAAAVAGSAYTAVTVTATGGSGTYTWSAAGLPSGMTIGASTGTISGTPASNTAGPFTVVVTVTDSTGAKAAMSYTLTVTAGTSLAPVISSVSTSAGGQALVAPNTWISIYGSNFAATGFIDNWKVPASGALPTSLDNVTVTIGGTQTYVNYLSAGQINVLAPNIGLGPVTVVVTTPGGGASAAFSVTSQAFAPGYFNWPNNQPVATHLDYTYAVANGTFTGTTTVPAAPGETIIFWGSGDGPTSPAIPYGTTVPAGTYATTNNVTASINGAPATVVGSVAYLTSGNAGLYQVAVTVPSGLANGSYPVTVTVNGVTSPNNLLLTVHN